MKLEIEVYSLSRHRLKFETHLEKTFFNGDSQKTAMLLGYKFRVLGS